jgi:hypothetical protein
VPDARSSGGNAVAEESGFQIARGAAEHYERHVVKFMGPLMQPAGGGVRLVFV